MASDRMSASTLRFMAKNYTVADDADDWEDALAAQLTATVPVALGGLRLDQALAKMFPQYSRNRLQAWLKTGHVLVDGKQAPASAKAAGGESVAVSPPPAADVAQPAAQAMALEIVHEDADLIVIDKP